MKAIQVHQLGGPEVMKLQDVPDPKPSAGEVLVRVKAAGVNPVDTYVRSGAYTMVKISLPYTPGSDTGGVVEAVGSGVTGLKKGDRVYTLGSAAGRHAGAYAELVVCEPWQVHKIPDSITFAQAAAVGVPYGTAYRALFQRAHALPSETVLVHGATGGVGIAAVQLARAYGMTVIGTGGTDKGRKLVSENGAHHVLDHRAPDYLDQLKKVTEGRGVDLVLEMLANVNLAKDLEILAARGRVVVIGCRGTIEINPRLTMAKDSAVIGMALWNSSPQDFANIHAGLVAGLENGTLKPVVGKELPLEAAPRAHEEVMKPGAYGKIVLVP